MSDIVSGEACTAEGCGGASAEAVTPTPVPAGTIDVVSDAICPWCWIGKKHLEVALAELSREGLTFTVRWRPFQLNPDMPLGGLDRTAFRIEKFGSEAMSRQRDAEVAEAGRGVGLAFNQALMTRVPNTLLAHRLIRAAGALGRQDAVVERLFQAYFTEGRDIGDRAVLADLAAEAGLDHDASAAMLAGTEHESEVLAEDMSVRRAGLSGVPSFLMDRYLLFSGAMPGARMAEAFRQAHRILSEQARRG